MGDLLPRGLMLYVAYGSNMHTGRLRRRVPSAQPLGRAGLDEWKLSYRKRSVDGSAKCTLVPAAGATALGVAFAVEDRHLTRLDRAEGPGYRRVTIAARVDDREVEAIIYVAEAGWIDASLQPYDWYLEYVLAGAAEHGLPPSYIESVLAVAAITDPDRERAALHLAMLDRTA